MASDSSSGDYCRCPYTAEQTLTESGSGAEQLAGFPQHSADRRRLTLGASGPQQAGGFADLQFACIDAAGHATLEIVLVSDWGPSGEPVETAQLRINMTAAALDRFVEALRALTVEPPNMAHLPLAK